MLMKMTLENTFEKSSKTTKLMMQLLGFSSLLTREITLKKPLREAEDTHRLFQTSSPKTKTEATSEM